MNNITILLLVLLFVLITCSIYIAENRISDMRIDREQLPKFIMNMRYPRHENDTIDVENTRDCNMETLEKCSMNDPTTLFGCRELLVRCTHFKEDMKYYNKDDEYKIVPKNASINEGYALAITNLNQACHHLHGDLVLVTRDVDSSDYMFVCKCKMDGYIGNDTITGNCTTVRICNGKIDNLDQTLDKINCVCADHEENYRYSDSLPICKSMTVKTANEKYTDWHFMVPWVSDNLLSKNYFNQTVAQNVNTSKLLNPCKHAIHDTSVNITGGRFDELYKTCVFENSGIPLRTGILMSVDADDDSQKFLGTFDGALYSSDYRQVRVLDGVVGKRQYAAITADVRLGDYLPVREYTVALPENTAVGNPGHVQLQTRQSLIAPECDTTGIMTYSCKMDHNFKRIVRGIPEPNRRQPPKAFLWGTDDWVEAYDMFEKGVVNDGRGLMLDNVQLDKYKNKLNYYGMRLVTDHPDNEFVDNGLVRLLDDSNYNKHSELIQK